VLHLVYVLFNKILKGKKKKVEPLKMLSISNVF